MKTRFLRAASWFVCFSFTLTSLNPVSFAMTPEVSSAPFKTLAIPAEFGQVTDISAGSPGAPALIHIQSAHGNYSAEKNIESLLGFIEKHSKVRTVLLEGAASKLQPELFRLFPKDSAFNRKVTDKLMQEGYLTGPESFLVGSTQKTEGWGIEDLDAYKKDRDAFIKVVNADTQTQKFLMARRADLSKHFASKLNKDLLTFVRQGDAFDSEALSFEAWLKVLGAASAKHLRMDLADSFNQVEWPFLVRYARLHAIGSKIDSQKARSEARSFLKELEKRKISQEIISSFKAILAKPEAELFKASGKSANSYSALRLAFDKAFGKLPKDFSMKAWPNWSLYAQYAILTQELESKGLHEEMNRLQGKLFDALAKTADEKAYVAQTRELNLQRKLFALELTRSEYEELLQRRADSVGRRENPKASLNAPRSTLGALEETAMDFYATAVVREQKMFENALAKMAEKKTKRAVIVTGGFHAEGLKKLASSQGCAYMQITPRIDEITKRDHEIYLRSILGARDFESSQMSALLALDQASMGQVLGAKVSSWLASIRELIKGMINSAPVLDRPALLADLSRSSLLGQTSAARSEVRASQTFFYEAAGVHIIDDKLTHEEGVQRMEELDGVLAQVNEHTIGSRDSMRVFASEVQQYPVSVRQAVALEISAAMQPLEESPSGKNGTELIVLREKRKLLSEPGAFISPAVSHRSETRANDKELADLERILDGVNASTIHDAEAMKVVAADLAGFSAAARKTLAAEVTAAMDMLESGRVDFDETQRDVLGMQRMLLVSGVSMFGSDKPGEGKEIAELRALLDKEVNRSSVSKPWLMRVVAVKVARYSSSVRGAVVRQINTTIDFLQTNGVNPDQTQRDVLATQKRLLTAPGFEFEPADASRSEARVSDLEIFKIHQETIQQAIADLHKRYFKEMSNVRTSVQLVFIQELLILIRKGLDLSRPRRADPLVMLAARQGAVAQLLMLLDDHTRTILDDTRGDAGTSLKEGVKIVRSELSEQYAAIVSAILKKSTGETLKALGQPNSAWSLEVAVMMARIEEMKQYLAEKTGSFGSTRKLAILGVFYKDIDRIAKQALSLLGPKKGDAKDVIQAKRSNIDSLVELMRSFPDTFDQTKNIRVEDKAFENFFDLAADAKVDLDKALSPILAGVATSRSEVRKLGGTEFYYNAHGIKIHDPKLTQKAGEQQMAQLSEILEDVDGNTIRSRQAMIDVAKRVAEYSLSARKALSAKILASINELGSGALLSDKTQRDVLAEQYLILIRPDSFFTQETKMVANRSEIRNRNLENAGVYPPQTLPEGPSKRVQREGVEVKVTGKELAAAIVRVADAEHKRNSRTPTRMPAGWGAMFSSMDQQSYYEAADLFASKQLYTRAEVLELLAKRDVAEYVQDRVMTAFDSLVANRSELRAEVLPEAKWIEVAQVETQIKRAFGTNGIRSDDIEIDGQRRIAAGTADVLAAEWRAANPGKDLPWVMVGFDPRPQGENGFTPGEMSESKAVAEVFAAYGFKVLFVPKAVAAPFMISASGKNVHPRDIYAAAMRTASHNEVVDPKSGKLVSGFKLFMENAPAADSFTGLISAKINDAEFSREVPVLNFDQAVSEGKIVVSQEGDKDDPDTVEFSRMQKAFDLTRIGTKLLNRFPGFKIALNTMNGGMSQFGPRVLEAMGLVRNKGFWAFNTTLMNDPSMKSQMLGWVEYQDATMKETKKVRFAPDPTRAWMRGKGYQDFVAQDPMKTLALLIDGDADRLVAELGKEIIPNEIGMLAAYYLAKYQGQKGRIVRTVPTTGGLDALAKALGLGDVAVTPVGSKWFAGPNKYYDSNLNDVLVAVEESGHIVFNKKGQLFFDHSIGLATLMLEMMAETGKTWSELSDEMWAFIEEKTGQKRIATVRDGISKEDSAEKYYPLVSRLGNPAEDAFRREFAGKMEATLAKAGLPWKVANMDITDAGGAQLQFEGGRKVFPRKSGTDGSVRLYVEVLETERDQVPLLIKSMREVMDSYVSARSETRKILDANAALGIIDIGEQFVRRAAFEVGAGLIALNEHIIERHKQGKIPTVHNDIPLAAAKGGAVSSKRSEMRDGMLPRVDPTKTQAWKQLRALVKEMKKKANTLRELFRNDPERVSKLTMDLREDVAFDFSKQRITEQVLDTLVQLAEQTGVSESIEKMFTGVRINETENRAVLHVALRNVKRDPETGRLVAANGPILADGQDVMPGVIQVLEQMERFVNSIHSGVRVGYTQRKIKNVINVGIGGSDLGGKMATRALTPYQFKKKDGVNVYYVSNVDGTDFAEVVKDLDPEETMVVIASKTFTTAETMQNARSAKDWILRHYGVESTDQEKADEVVNAHFIALSTASELVKKFGITPDEEHMFPFWDWVGGRYSVWSAIGLPLATYIGFDNFLKFLEGARYVDEHFRTTPLRENIPVIKALLNVWNGNFLGARSFAVLPYDQYLSLFPEFAQQFFMESNGKIASRIGRFVRYITGLILWGAAGTNGQHSFYQLIHQGTHLIPADFIGVLKTHNPLPGHHAELFSNVPAQTEALAFGANKEEVKELLEKDSKYQGKDIDWHAAQQTFPGNKPTTTIVLDEVSPETLGMLVALYEHQIFVESVVLNIFAFDQWGVQLGKKVALKVHAFLTGKKAPEEIAAAGISASGEWLIRRWLTRGGGSQAGVESKGGAASKSATKPDGSVPQSGGRSEVRAADEVGEVVLEKTDHIPGFRDVPRGQLFLGKYAKLYPLALQFFKLYGGKVRDHVYGMVRNVGQLLWDTKVSIGDTKDPYYDLDFTAKKVVLNRDFVDFLNRTGRKKIFMSYLAGAIQKVHAGRADVDTEELEVVLAASKQSLVLKHLGGRPKTRLDDVKALYDLEEKVLANDEENVMKRYFLQDQDIQLLIADILMSGKTLDAGRLQRMLIKSYGYYGEITEKKAGELLQAFHKAHENIMLVSEVVTKDNIEKLKAKLAAGAQIQGDFTSALEEMTPKTTIYGLKKEFVSDPAFHGRNFIWDVEAERQDEVNFGGKSAQTGELMFAEHAVTLPNFFSHGELFQNIFAANDLRRDFIPALQARIQRLRAFQAEHASRLQKPLSEFDEAAHKALSEDLRVFRLLLEEDKEAGTPYAQIDQFIRSAEELIGDMESFEGATLTEFFEVFGKKMDEKAKELADRKGVYETEQAKLQSELDILQKEAIKLGAFAPADITTRIQELQKAIEKLTPLIKEVNREEQAFTASEAERFLVAARNFVLNDDIVSEMKDYLRQLAERMGISVQDLVLAIRSSGVGEDGETASFAGRQDTYIFVTPGKPTADDPDGLNAMVESWIFNQASLFNKRAIGYRFQHALPTFDSHAEISTLFQEMFLSTISFIAFSVDRGTGFGAHSIQAMEGQGEMLVSGKESGSQFVITHDGRRLNGAIGVRKLKVVETPDGKGKVTVPVSKKEAVEFAITDHTLLKESARYFTAIHEFYGGSKLGGFMDLEGAWRSKRDENGKPVYLKDPETGEVLKDERGNPRLDWTIVSTQARPETVISMQNPDVIKLRRIVVPDAAYQKAEKAGKVLSFDFIAKTGGTAQGEVEFIFNKRDPEELARAQGKIMVTDQSDPDMESAMRSAKGIIALLGGQNSHTMIVATEFGLIAITGTKAELLKFLKAGDKITLDAERGKILLGYDHELRVAGNDFNVRNIPNTDPGAIRSATIVATVNKAMESAALSKIPSDEGIGLTRLELVLKQIGIYPDLLMAYDNYMAKKEGRSYDLNGPILDPKIAQDRKDIKMVKDWIHGFNSGEDFYTSILSEFIRAMSETLKPPMEEVLLRAQKIQNDKVRAQAVKIVRDYYAQNRFGDLKPLKQLTALEGELSGGAAEDLRNLQDAVRLLNKWLKIRLDDRKSDEYEGIPGATRFVKKEINPMKGLRGLELLLSTPTLRWQLRAIAKVAHEGHGKLGVFAPVVRRPSAVRKLLEIMDEEGLTSDVAKRGIMTEIPINSLLIKKFLATGIDFISTGGNDGEQTTNRKDRNASDSFLAEMGGDFSKAALRWNAVIGQAVKEYNEEHGTHIEAGFCGNAASVRGQDDYAIFLRKVGYGSVSVVVEQYEGVANRLVQPDHKARPGLLDETAFKLEIDPRAHATTVDASVVKIEDLRLGIGFHYRLLLDQAHGKLTDTLKKAKVSRQERGEILSAVDEFIQKQGISPNESGSGRRAYKAYMAKKILEAFKKAQKDKLTLLIATDDATSDQYRALLGGRFYEPKEANPELGVRGFVKASNHDAAFTGWDLEVIAELMKPFNRILNQNLKAARRDLKAAPLNGEAEPESLKTAGGLAFLLRGIQDSHNGDVTPEIKRFKRMLKRADLEEVPFGLDFTVAGNLFETKEIAESGAKFFAVSDPRQLASEVMTKEAENINGHPLTDEEVREAVEVPFQILNTAAAKHNIPLYIGGLSAPEIRKTLDGQDLEGLISQVVRRNSSGRAMIWDFLQAGVKAGFFTFSEGVAGQFFSKGAKDKGDKSQRSEMRVSEKRDGQVAMELQDAYVSGVDEALTRVHSVGVATLVEPRGQAGLFEMKNDLPHATQVAAHRVLRWMHNLGDKNKFTKNLADGETTYWIREYYNRAISWLQGVIVIGEGERDKAPMLYIGELVGKALFRAMGDATKRLVDIAIDVLELTNGMVRESVKATVSIAAYAPKGGLMNAPDFYISKWIVGPKAKGQGIDVEKPTVENIKILSGALGKPASQLKGAILFRSIHVKRIVELIDAGIDVGDDALLSDLVQKVHAKADQKELDAAFKALDKAVKEVGIYRVGNLYLLADGDLTPVFALATPEDYEYHLDFVTGRGGAPEGVLAGVVAKAIGGEISARFVSAARLKEQAIHADLDRDGLNFTREEIARFHKFGFADPGTSGFGKRYTDVFKTNELVPADDFTVIASAVKENPWVPGLQKPEFDFATGEFTGYTVRASSSGRVELIKTTYDTLVKDLRARLQEIKGMRGTDETIDLQSLRSLSRQDQLAYAKIAYQLGRVYLVYQRFDEAAALFKKAQALEQRSSEGQYYEAAYEHAMGLKALLKGEGVDGRSLKGGDALLPDYFEVASAHFAKSLSLSQERRDPQLRTREILVGLNLFRGETAFEAKRWDLARGYLQRVIKRDPENLEAAKLLSELPSTTEQNGTVAARSEVRTLTAEQLQAPVVSFSETLAKLNVSIKGVTGTAKNVTGGLYARTILATASARTALLELAASGERSEGLVKKSMETAMMLLGLRGVTDSDVFVLGNQFFLRDARAAAGMRKLYGQATLMAIVTTPAELQLLEDLNKHLAKESLQPIVAVDAKDVAGFRARLGRIKNAVVRPVLLGGEVLPEGLQKLLAKNQMIVTDRMFNGFVAAVDMLVAGLVGDLQARFAMARSA